MYIVTCVYNALSKFARRFIYIMKTTEFMSGLSMVLIPLGFSLLAVAYSNKNDPSSLGFLIAGIIGTLSGIILANITYRRIGNEEKQRINNTFDKQTATELRQAIQELTAELRKRN